ncbi:uncharacterized protein PAC_07255 [Phialocephala subalpina]|uniref:Actin cortical patch SUR7/pH-response regulator PalI n=1 Tax=Phialocephala subalpina TaxID=576137 RepID=A0A1L7WX63_9HELO|nr:uncharacterized protein PAC_07255 [Phialocephala subalpina]
METPKSRRVRLTALVPFAFLIVSFVLTLLAVLSGSAPGMFENSNLLTVNSSTVGQNIVKFTPATNTGKRSSILDPFGLSTSSTTKSSSAPSSTATGGLAGGLQGILGQIGDVFNGVVQNITDDLDSGLTKIETEVASSITKYLGISDYYSLHMNNICMGSYANASNPGSTYSSEKCMSYSNATSGLSNINIPSSIKIANTNISAPILSSVSGAGGTLGSAVTILTKAIFASFVISLIGSSISALGSLLSFLLPQNSILIYINLGFSLLGFTFHAIGTAAATAAVAAINSAANSIGNDISLYSKAGSQFLVFVWISFGLMLVSSLYWSTVWFVEVRTWSVRLRRRTIEEVGNYSGLLGEVGRDFKAESKLEIGKEDVKIGSYF